MCSPYFCMHNCHKRPLRLVILNSHSTLYAFLKALKLITAATLVSLFIMVIIATTLSLVLWLICFLCFYGYY
jgi:hypothetical protein